MFWSKAAGGACGKDQDEPLHRLLRVSLGMGVQAPFVPHQHLSTHMGFPLESRMVLDFRAHQSCGTWQNLDIPQFMDPPLCLPPLRFSLLQSGNEREKTINNHCSMLSLMKICVCLCLQS